MNEPFGCRHDSFQPWDGWLRELNGFFPELEHTSIRLNEVLDSRIDRLLRQD